MVTTCPRLMPGGRVSRDWGFPRHIFHLRVRVSRDRWRVLASTSLGQGETLPCGFLTACPWALAPGCGTAGVRRVLLAGEPSGQPHEAVTASGDWGLRLSWSVPLLSQEGRPWGARAGSPCVPRCPWTPPWGWESLSSRFPACRGGMASATAPAPPAAMAVDREAWGAGAFLGPEEHIDEDVLANILSALWPTPAVVDDKCGRYPWTPLGGSIVEQRFDAVDSRLMTAIWTTIRGTEDTLYAVPEGTVTEFPFLCSREDWRVCQMLRHLADRESPPEVGEKPHFSWEYFPGSPPELR